MSSMLCTPHAIRLVKPRTVRWAGHVARMGGDEKCVPNFGWNYSEVLGVNGGIILKLILGKQTWGVWIGFI
jgi:hypothetical protein